MQKDVLIFFPHSLCNMRDIREIDYSPFPWKNTFIIVHQLKQLEKKTNICVLLIYTPQVHFVSIGFSWLIIYLTRETTGV